MATATSEAQFIPYASEQGQRTLADAARTDDERRRDGGRSSVLSDGDEAQLAAQVRELFSIARDHRRPLIAKWRKNYRMLFNRYWDPSSRAEWQASAQVSEIFPIVSSLVGWMTDQRFNYEINASMDANSQYHNFWQSISADLQNLMNSSWHVNDEEFEVTKMLWDGHIYGTGFLKTIWDPTLAGGLGDGTHTRVDPFTIYPDPNARGTEDWDYVVEVKHMSLAAVDRRWPGSAEKLMGASTESIDQAPDQLHPSIQERRPRVNIDAIAPATVPQWGRRPGQNRMPFYHDGVTVFECWVREHSTAEVDHITADGERLTRTTVVEDWRVIVMAQDKILMDEQASDLWSYASHPYARYVTADLGEFWGPSLVEILTNPQVIINRMLSAIQSNVELVGSPPLIEPDNSGLQRTKMHNRPGERLTANVASTNMIRWLEAPRLHEGITDLLRYMQSRMEFISGLTAINRGQSTGGRNAEGVMEAQREAGFVRVRMALRELERTLRNSGAKKASLIIDNYTAPRAIATVGPGGERSTLALKARHFQAATKFGSVPLRYTIRVDAGSNTHTSRQLKEDMAFTLYTLGAIDEQALLSIIEFPNWEETVQRVLQARSQGMLTEPGKRERQRA